MQGQIQDFHLGGGGTKDYVPACTLRAFARNRIHFRQGSMQGPFKGDLRTICRFSYIKVYKLITLVQSLRLYYH